MRGTNSRVSRTIASQLTRTWLNSCVISLWVKAPYWPRPALLIRMSTHRPAPSVASKIFCGAAESFRSAATMRTSVPLALSSPANASSRSTLRAVRMSLAPRLGSSLASAAPIPALAPVTSAHLPLKSCVFAIANPSYWMSAAVAPLWLRPSQARVTSSAA